MGRHVNFADEQDRWLNKAEKLNRKSKQKNVSLEDRDPATLSLAEQFELERRRNEKKQKLREEQKAKETKQPPRYSLHKPKN
jgi:hypothetical protein